MYSSLFNSGHIDDHVVNVRNQMCGEIEGVPAHEILAADAPSLAAEFSAKYQIDCPSFLPEEISFEEPAFSGGHEEVSVRVHLPFNGDHRLFKLSGGTAPIIQQPVEIYPGELVCAFKIEKRRLDQLQPRVLAFVKRIEEGLTPIQQNLNFHNPTMKKWALQKIEEKKTHLASHSKLLSDLEKTGFTLRRRGDSSEKLIVPVKPTPITVRPKAETPSQEPELSLQDYDEILNVIRSMVSVFERSPTVFKAMEEEHLRTILLVALNGLFKGNATGETFNGAGKTDILIRVNDNNIFIAECLIWSGPDHFRKVSARSSHPRTPATAPVERQYTLATSRDFPGPGVFLT